MTDISTQETKQIAAEAYQYLYSLVLMDITRRVSTNVAPGVRPGMGPMNTWLHMRAFPPGDFKEVVRPNFDTLYSIVWFDLTKEPVIISVPDSGGRYYLLPILDMWSDVVAVPGRRTSGTSAGNFALTGPGWTGELPAGVTRIRVSTPYAWTIGRTQTNGPIDYGVVNAFQDGFRLSLLSDWGGESRPVKFVLDPTVDMKTPPLDQVNKMSAEEFFTYGLELMKLHPPHVTDGSMLLRMARVGLKAGASFDYSALDSSVKSALSEGVRTGLEEMIQYMSTRTKPRNGWTDVPGAIGVYGNDYLARAVIAMIGLGANPMEDAIYPVCVADANGEPVMGEKRYTVHFDADKLPPVGAFWSLTMYDHEGFPVPNALDRYAIGDRDALVYNADGSLDIYIQYESPGPDKESNWLPSPASGELGLTMRLYQPMPAILSGAWVPPPLVKVN
jgi:hypothetical protein